MSEQQDARRREAAGAENTQRTDERRALSFDNVVGRWSVGMAKEGLDKELGATRTLLRTAQALRQVQLDAVERALQAHAEAVRRLQSARSVVELASIGLNLAQGNLQRGLRYWAELSGVATASGVEGWKDAVAAFAGASGVGRGVADHWLDTALHARIDTLEAQAEHVINPLAASPLYWPAQEAMREAASFGLRNWSPWSGSSALEPEGDEEPPTRH